jgi:UDP-N-acetylmuramoylalanine--D-glutamate ligase
VGIVLNVTEDHLDRYRDMEHYARTKAHVFDGLVDDGLALLADDDPWTDAIAPDGGPVVRVGGPQARVVGDGEGDRLQLSATESIDRARLRLRGRHNASNAIFAVLAARHLGVDLATCARGLAEFEGLPHRMVHVRDLNQVAYYDDSKATNVASALASLGGLSGKFVLIAGGIAKGDDLRPLAALLAAHGRAVVGIGRDRDHFLRLAPDGMPTVSADDMPQAVAAARDLARPGDAVVLAPACASFDQYRNYAERGDAFTTAVHAL